MYIYGVQVKARGSEIWIVFRRSVVWGYRRLSFLCAVRHHENVVKCKRCLRIGFHRWQPVGENRFKLGPTWGAGNQFRAIFIQNRLRSVASASGWSPISTGCRQPVATGGVRYVGGNYLWIPQNNGSVIKSSENVISFIIQCFLKFRYCSRNLVHILTNFSC